MEAPVDNGELRSISGVGVVVRPDQVHDVRGAEGRGAGLKAGRPGLRAMRAGEVRPAARLRRAVPAEAGVPGRRVILSVWRLVFQPGAPSGGSNGTTCAVRRAAVPA
ncbi:MAG: hypothetical protein OYL41_01835 [Acidobacteriota bacterium]|nr:hypothetical protein [Acidobacteriota bacterium]